MNFWIGRFLLLSTLILTAGCGGQPQFVLSRESLQAVDALWTAIGTHKPDLLTQSAEEIKRLHTAGKIPDDAFASLEGIIQTADSGDWTEARRELRALISAQRRPE